MTIHNESISRIEASLDSDIFSTSDRGNDEDRKSSISSASILALESQHRSRRSSIFGSPQVVNGTKDLTRSTSVVFHGSDETSTIPLNIPNLKYQRLSSPAILNSRLIQRRRSSLGVSNMDLTTLTIPERKQTYSLFDCMNGAQSSKAKYEPYRPRFASHSSDKEVGSSGKEGVKKSFETENDILRKTVVRRPTIMRFPTLDREGNILDGHDSSAPSWIIYPDSRIFQVQRFLVVSSTVITAIFLPPFMVFEFLNLPYVIVINWIIDVIFLANILMILMTAVPVEGGGFITDPKIIRLKYTRSKDFIIDCIASIPWELIATVSGSQQGQFLSTLRVLRLLRMKNFNITNSQTNLGMLARQIMVLVLLGHFCGCAWWGAALSQDFPVSTFYMLGDGFIADWHMETKNTFANFVRNYLRLLFWGLSSMCSFTANLKPETVQNHPKSLPNPDLQACDEIETENEK